MYEEIPDSLDTEKGTKLIHIPIQFTICMRSRRCLTINLQAQFETIFMGFIFCKISNLVNKPWDCDHLTEFN